MNDVMRRCFGSTDAECKTCKHLLTGEWHDKTYHKCELYGLSHSEATDWRVSEQACGMYNMYVKRSEWVPVIDRPKPKARALAVEGQVEMTI